MSHPRIKGIGRLRTEGNLLPYPPLPPLPMGRNLTASQLAPGCVPQSQQRNAGQHKSGTFRRGAWAGWILQPFQHLRRNGGSRLSDVHIDKGEVGGVADTGGQIGLRIAEYRCRGRMAGGLPHRAGGKWVASPGVQAVLCNLPDGELQPRGQIARGRRLVVQQPRNLLKTGYGRGWRHVARQKNGGVVSGVFANVGEQLDTQGCAVKCTRNAGLGESDVDDAGKGNVLVRAIFVEVEIGIPEADSRDDNRVRGSGSARQHRCREHKNCASRWCEKSLHQPESSLPWTFAKDL